MGSVRLAVNGEPWNALRTRKVLALLVYLAVTRQAQSRESLANLLWGERAQTQALTNLRVALSDLRHKLGRFVAIDRFDVALHAGMDIWVDSVALEALVADGRGSAADLLHAVDLYQGPFLEGFAIHGAPDFDSWMMTTGEHIHEQVLGAYRALAQTYLARQQLVEGIAICRRWLALDPLAEDGHRLLMRMLAMQGNRAEAIQQYEAARQLLSDELSVEPDPQTDTLLVQIAGGQWSGSVSQASELATVRPLPPDMLPFFGRELELARLERMLADDSTRLVTITGQGGTGKTRLALAVARRQQEQKPSPYDVAFVPLATVEDADQLLPALAENLGLALASESDPLQQLFTFLRLRRLLLILDNFEQINGGATWLRQMLDEVPWIKVLVTSRQALHLQAEQVLVLSGLPYPDDIANLVSSPAARFFTSVARRADQDFVLQPRDHEALLRICHLVEGLPLALELAAGWTSVMSVPAVAAAIAERFDFLSAFAIDMPERHRSIEAVFAATWDGLSAAGEAQAAAFSIFRGGATRPALQAVLSITEVDLATLVERGVLRYDRQNDRYEMHELLRQYAQRQLFKDPELVAATQKRHSEFFAAFLHDRTAQLRGHGQVLALREIEADGENIAQAWRQACSTGDVGLIEQGLEALSTFYLWRNRYQDGTNALAEAVDGLASRSAEPEVRLLLARLSTWQATFSERLLRRQTALSLLQRGLSLLAEGGLRSAAARHAEAMVRLRRARLLWQDGEYDEGKSELERALVLFTETGDTWGVAHVYALLGDIANNQGDYATGRSWLESALGLFVDMGDGRDAAYVQERLSFVKRDLGEFIAAEQHSRIALELYEALGDSEHLAGGYVALGWILIYMGRFAEALPVVEQGAELYANLGLPPPLIVLGIVNAELGRYKPAIAYAERHVMACRLLGDTVEMALGLNVLATIAIVESRVADAEQLLTESIGLLEDGDEQRDRLAQGQALYGFVARSRGERVRAKCIFASVLHTCLEIHSIIPLLFALPGAALLLADDGRAEEAWQLYAPLERLPIVANSQMRADLAGRELGLAKTPRGHARAHIPPPPQEPLKSAWDLARDALRLLDTL